MQKGARPKKHQVPMDSASEEPPVLNQLEEAEQEQGTELHNLAELSNLLRGFMRQQSDREARWELEKQRQEDRWRKIQHQFTQLQQEVQSERREHQLLLEGATADTETCLRPTAEHPAMPQLQSNVMEATTATQSASLRRPPAWKGPKMQPFNEDEDIEHYLTTFERIASGCQWPHEDWALHLAPLLTGKARAAFVAMDIDEIMDYVKVKKAVLEKFEICAETYRLRFRSTTLGEGETPKELRTRLKELYDKWIVPKEKSKDEIGDVIVLEQFLRVLNPELRTWIKEHNPTTSKQAAELADAFLAARRPLKNYGSPKPLAPVIVGRTESGNSQKTRNFRQGPHNSTSSRAREIKQRGPLVCHSCGQTGHFRADCPSQTVSNTYMCFSSRGVEGQEDEVESLAPSSQHERTTCVFIEEKPCVALLDSGSSRTLVRQECLPRDASFCGKVKVWCVHGNDVDYPIANINIQIDGKLYLLSVGVMSKLPYQVVLGRDLPILRDLIARGEEINPSVTAESMVAVTRSKHKHHADEGLGWSEFPFANSDVPDVEGSSQGLIRKSRAQRRQAKVRGTKFTEPVPVPQCDELPVIPGEIAQLQREDPSLAPLFSKSVTNATEVTERGRELFFLKGDLLYRRSRVGDQLVVPTSLRSTVLQLAHSVPWAGHLGQAKTFSRMSPRFYWPQQFTDTVQFCKSCPECQLTAPGRKGERAPLIPMPVIDTPFSRVAMDIIGPLERSSAGHRYILVVCDYATRYPEAFPLKKVKARQIANCLIQMFSRVGIPKEIITDQGSNFTSNFMREVYRLLGIKGIKTTPYHPQTDGLVERFNKTLKAMLRKFVKDTGADWDQWLPFLLFAYREVPQASTGFSPFQLLYGHAVRGPLDVLKEAWEAPNPRKQCNVLSYVLKMRDKLEELQELANTHLVGVQQRQKQSYDKAARRRIFQEGQKVLLLLPSSENSLLAKWQGPYAISRKVGPVTYELHMPERRKKHQIFHVNLLKEWFDRPASSLECWARAVVKEEEPRELFFPSPAGQQPVPDVSHLTSEQQEELTAIMPADLFSTKPGCTNLIQHEIRLHCPNQKPIRDTTSRVPAKLMPALKQEVEDMLDMGVIEPSRGEWCSPVVLVPKKNDSKQRFCVDFSKLNAVSAFDAYPMPRVEELIERLGNAKYLTTLDLCKGYWQVPLTESSKDLTTFRVPSGLYRFRTMPFGLHGAPATFQRLVDEVLRGADGYSAAYIDDIVVFSETWEDHVQHLSDVFQRIKRAGLVINAHKCHIAKSEVEYLGYVIGGGVIRPQVSKIEALRAYPPPTTKRKVKSFLGLAGWYRRFIPNFSARAAVLSDLTRKSSPTKVKWTAECDAAFVDLKNCLCSEPVLQCPDFTQPFTLQTDASGEGLGAVLLQGEGENKRPVVYISRKLFPREMKYSTIEKEALAIKWALDTLKYYLMGDEFVLETDHRALQWMNRMKDSNARITRWYLSLQPFRFRIQYRPGHKNVVADFLSRSMEE
uniref:Gypsy retrotransposon integrase-like protein 1 n=1 Tax=Oreochromis niloticus TaxID=8128 RepID=A0A669EG75_ORENI